MGCPAWANTKEEEKTEWEVDQVSFLFEGTPKPKVGSHRLDWMSHFISISLLTVPTIAMQCNALSGFFFDTLAIF